MKLIKLKELSIEFEEKLSDNKPETLDILIKRTIKHINKVLAKNFPNSLPQVQIDEENIVYQMFDINEEDSLE